MPEITVGFIGAGTIVSSHVRAVEKLPDFKLVSICDISETHLKKRMQELDIHARPFTDYHRLLEDPPDVVLVAIPHGLHCEVTLEAFRAGCHVLVEKPMAVSVEECSRMLKAARQHQRQLLVSEQASFHPGAVLTGKKFRAGDLGRFFTGSKVGQRLYVRDTRPAWFLDPAMSGGGMFANVGMHLLATGRACLPGLTPMSVSASVSRVPEYEIEACTSMLVRYKQGAAMHYAEIGYYPTPEWHQGGTPFVFEEGMVSWSGKTWQMITRQGKEFEHSLPDVDLFTSVYDNVRRAIRGEEYGPKAAEYAQDIAIVRAAYESGRSGHEIQLAEPLDAIQRQP